MVKYLIEAADGAEDYIENEWLDIVVSRTMEVNGQLWELDSLGLKMDRIVLIEIIGCDE